MQKYAIYFLESIFHVNLEKDKAIGFVRLYSKRKKKTVHVKAYSYKQKGLKYNF